MEKELLPIGTVVTLKGGTVKLMIVGFCAIDPENPERMYDYSAIPYPIGEVVDTGKGVFDHEQIEIIEHMGLESDEDKEFKKQINLFLQLGQEEIEKRMKEMVGEE